MENILLLGKQIIMDESKVLLQYSPGEDWQDYFMPMNGHWDFHDGYIWGTEPGNFGGILLSRESGLQMTNVDQKVAETTANIIGRQMEQ